MKVRVTSTESFRAFDLNRRDIRNQGVYDATIQLLQENLSLGVRKGLDR